MGKVTLCTDKYLDVKPIVALLETEFYDIKLFYKTESIRELKPKYLKYMTMDQQFNIIYSLIKTRETMVKSYFFLRLLIGCALIMRLILVIMLNTRYVKKNILFFLC